jgi:hypothetical protein
VISARVLADSLSPMGDRLTTLEVTFPRFILAEFNTHRVFSRNSASSRAIPVNRIIERVEADPFVPKAFPINKPGMSATEYIVPGDSAYEPCRWKWLAARDAAVDYARSLVNEGVHKQIANRLLEPFMWHTVIVSSTEWRNFFELRISKHAQPEMRETATKMWDMLLWSRPKKLEYGQWHLPLISEDDERSMPLDRKIKSSVARVAAVSYDRHTDRDYDKEATRFEMLAQNKHLSPFEHVATPSSDSYEWANFHGWKQARWDVERGQEVYAL